MRSDGLLERFDELIDVVPMRHKDATRRAASASLATLFSYMEEALQYYQGFYQPHPRSGWTGYFPYAWYLKEGMEVLNTTIGDRYTIKEVAKDTKGLPTGLVVMEGNVEPEPTHRLRFRREDSLIFMHAFPKTFAKTYDFEGGGLLATEKAEPWRDTITFMVIRKEPGGMGGKPFEQPREVRPQPRIAEDYIPDLGYTVSFTSQEFDCLIQLDCWSKTNATAEKLVAWFELFMEVYRGVFIYNGLKQVLYWQRTADALVTRWRDDIVNRTLQYFTRIENVTYRVDRKVNEIAAAFGLWTGELPPLGAIFGSGWVYPTGDGTTIPVEVHESKDGG